MGMLRGVKPAPSFKSFWKSLIFCRMSAVFCSNFCMDTKGEFSPKASVVTWTARSISFCHVACSFLMDWISAASPATSSAGAAAPAFSAPAETRSSSSRCFSKTCDTVSVIDWIPCNTCTEAISACCNRSRMPSEFCVNPGCQWLFL